MKKTGFLVLGSLIFMLGGISGALLQSSFDVKWSAPKTGAVSQQKTSATTKTSQKNQTSQATTTNTTVQGVNRLVSQARGRTSGYANTVADFKNTQWCVVQLDDQNPIDSQRQETFCFRLGFLTISGANREPSLFQVRSIEKFQKASDQGAINYFILQLRAPQQETTHQVTLTDVFHHEVAIEDPDNLLQLTTPSNHLFFETKLKSAGNPVVD